MLPARELLPADLAGVRSFSRVGSHVSLQDALVHGGEAAVGALEFLPDHRELVDCKRARRTGGLVSERSVLLASYFTIRLIYWEITILTSSPPAVS